MSKRITKSELADMRTLGALKPVDHAVLAFADDAKAGEAQKALAEAGLGGEDVLVFSSAELFPDVKDMMRTASGAAGFGYEIVLMRRYMTLASEGAGWLIVYAPDEEQIKKVQEVARSSGSRSAVHYGHLTSEELV
jgi:hypothetical protein